MKAISRGRLSAVAAAAACLVIGTATSASAGTNSPISNASNGDGWHYRTVRNTSGCQNEDTRHPWNIPEGASVWVRACGSVEDNYSNSGDGYLGTGHDCDLTQGGQRGVA
ncbi:MULTISPECIES: hypothetical protein [unclassified Streptomyces]|uniref:hypothetical protein n=1 Tax=unclassified Streptomyces TaxID=2593676 RepID=UPI0036E474AA